MKLESDEERMNAYIEWMKKRLPKALKGKKLKHNIIN
jgi:hypothetical protein